MKYKTVDLWCRSIDINSPARLTKYRLKKYEKFFKPWIKEGLSSVRDLGEINKFGQKLAKAFKLDYCPTDGDFNFITVKEMKKKNTHEWIDPEGRHVELTAPEVVFCFEVLEHLINPANLLRSLVWMHSTLFFVTYPRFPEWLWQKIHFHEFRDAAFFTLVKESGFEILDFKKIRIWHNPLFYLSGIRPFIRFWLTLLGIARHRFAVLKPRGNNAL